jgi:hypothetical protein
MIPRKADGEKSMMESFPHVLRVSGDVLPELDP